jgi:hypothetical protein
MFSWGSFSKTIGARWGADMELARQGSYRQLAEEIGEVLQAAAETAEKIQDDARAEATRIRDDAEEQLRTACTEARRILDEARMEADMVRAEAEWQSQEIIAQARRTVAERLAGADTRLAEVEQAESRVLDRLAGVGQVLADSLAALREPVAATTGTDIEIDVDAAAADDHDSPTAKVYFVEFPPMAPPAPGTVDPGPVDDADEIVLSASPGASLFADDGERSEWSPPSDLPAWWTRGGVQG